MNAQVQEFINKMKEEEKERELRLKEEENAKELKRKEEELKQKENHLISLGLIDKEKSSYKKIYNSERTIIYDKWDSQEKKYYKEIKSFVPIEVTDEEYQEILKYAPLIEEKKESIRTNEIECKEEDTHKPETTWANAIKIIANILLVLNIIGGIILHIVLADNYSTDDFAWIPLVSALTYCILWYPLIVGFSKVVKVAEKNLQE